MAAVLTWLAVTWEQHVDVRVERDTAVVRADRAAFNAGFEHDWSAVSGQRRPDCDPGAAAELTRLRQRAAELEAKLSGSSAEVKQDANALRSLMMKDKR